MYKKRVEINHSDHLSSNPGGIYCPVWTWTVVEAGVVVTKLYKLFNKHMNNFERVVRATHT